MKARILLLIIVDRSGSKGVSDSGRASWPCLTDGRPNTDDPRHFGAARLGRIGRSKLGSIDLGIVGSGALRPVPGAGSRLR